MLAHHLQPQPSHEVTVMAQMGEVVFGKSNPLYYVLQFSTAAILTPGLSTSGTVRIVEPGRTRNVDSATL